MPSAGATARSPLPARARPTPSAPPLLPPPAARAFSNGVAALRAAGLEPARRARRRRRCSAAQRARPSAGSLTFRAPDPLHSALLALAGTAHDGCEPPPASPAPSFFSRLLTHRTAALSAAQTRSRRAACSSRRPRRGVAGRRRRCGDRRAGHADRRSILGRARLSLSSSPPVHARRRAQLGRRRRGVRLAARRLRRGVVSSVVVLSRCGVRRLWRAPAASPRLPAPAAPPAAAARAAAAVAGARGAASEGRRGGGCFARGCRFEPRFFVPAPASAVAPVPRRCRPRAAAPPPRRRRRPPPRRDADRRRGRRMRQKQKH